MKKRLVGLVIVVGFCGGLYLLTAGSIHYLQLSAQWPEQRGLEASKLCRTDETLKIIRADNGGDIREDYVCEDAQGNRRNVTDEAEKKAPGLNDLGGALAGIVMVVTAVVIGFLAFLRETAEEGQLP